MAAPPAPSRTGLALGNETVVAPEKGRVQRAALAITVRMAVVDFSAEITRRRALRIYKHEHEGTSILIRN
jgi:hypothetical protein